MVFQKKRDYANVVLTISLSFDECISQKLIECDNMAEIFFHLFFHNF